MSNDKKLDLHYHVILVAEALYEMPIKSTGEFRRELGYQLMKSIEDARELGTLDLSKVNLMLDAFDWVLEAYRGKSIRREEP